MQLSIKAMGEEAKFLSFLLAKNPQNLYDRNEKEAQVRMTYTTFEDNEVEAVLFVTPDPVELVKNSPATYDITQYINDREFVVSSLFVSYIRSALGTALNGKPKEAYLKWVDHPFNLTIGFGPVASDLPDAVIISLFEALGFKTEIEREKIEYAFDLKARSSARFITIQGKATLQNTLRQIFILIPVLDNYKHYYIDEKEIEKLQRFGEGWLENHPQKELIIKRSLRFRELIEQVYPVNIDRKQAQLDLDHPDEPQAVVRLNELRYQKIIDLVMSLDTRETIVDYGAGEGKLSVRLGSIPGVKEILAVEPTAKEQLRAIERFQKAGRNEDFVTPAPLWGSLFYYDNRMKGKDVFILCEVIEHIEEYRLAAAMDTIFGHYQPKVIIITTPNSEYNEVYQMEETIRHKDHRFEWTTAQFQDWCALWQSKYQYSVEHIGIGEEVQGYGQPTQLAIFRRQVVNQIE